MTEFTRIPSEDTANALDTILQYHVNMILDYERKNSVDDLHAMYQGDPIFELFGLTDINFTRKRWAAGFANSCATNLGRFTDKAAKIILMEASGLDRSQLLKVVAISANDAIEQEETDGVVMLDEVSEDMRPLLAIAVERLAHQANMPHLTGLGFEFRGRYGKNDDTLLQKDEHMADAIKSLGAVPIMAIFSTANAKQAMVRLSRSWVVVTGHETVDLLHEITGFDLVKYLKSRQATLAPVVQLLST